MSDPLSNKMNQWEASPPPGVWKAISVELQEWNAEKKLAQRLGATEAIPPPGNWAAIAGQLAPEDTNKGFQRGDVPVRTLFPYFLRYGAAAIVIGLLAWVFSSNSFKGASEITTAAIPLQSTTPDPARNNNILEEASASTEPVPAVSQQGGSQAILSGASGNGPRRRKDPVHAPVKYYPEVVYQQTSNWEQALTRGLETQSIRSLPVQQRDLRYIRIAAQNGTMIRLSAKFAPIYHHLTNISDGFTGTILPINRIEQQIQKAHYVPYPGNMFDLLLLKELFQEN